MKFKKFLTDDHITIGVCVMALGIGYYALQSDFSFFSIGGANKGSSGLTLGKVAKVESDVRLRGTKNIFWSNARKNDVIDQGDSLFVGPGSSIVINFADGKSITIGANSLIKFKTENKKIKLNLQYGSIKSKSLPSQILIDDSSGKTFNIESKDGADIEIGKLSGNSKIQVKSKRGEVKINNTIINETNKELIVSPQPLVKLIEKPVVNEAIAKLESLQPDEVVKLNEMKPEEVQKKIEAEIRPLLPPELVKPKVRVLMNKDNPPAAEWQKAEFAKEYILETSETPEFTNPKVSRTPASLQTIESLNGNSIYYRLKSVGYNNTTSEYSKTGQIDVVYPGIVPKSDRIVYDYVAKSSQDVAKDKDFTVRWNEIPNADKYVVEVDQDEKFSNPKKYVVRKPAGNVRIPGEGKYKFRIAAYNTADRKISSTSKAGEIIYNRLFNMKTPSIEKAAASLTFFFQEGFGKYIWLKWAAEPLKSEEKFRVELAKDQNFSKILKSYSTKKNKVLIQENIPAGQYYWRVRSEKGENATQVSDWSKLGYIEINSGEQK